MYVLWWPNTSNQNVEIEMWMTVADPLKGVTANKTFIKIIMISNFWQNCLFYPSKCVIGVFGGPMLVSVLHLLLYCFAFIALRLGQNGDLLNMIQMQAIFVWFVPNMIATNTISIVIVGNRAHFPSLNVWLLKMYNSHVHLRYLLFAFCVFFYFAFLLYSLRFINAQFTKHLSR